MNKLYYGDCLTVMNNLALESVDLIYLDPPFNSNRNYNSIYKDETGQPLPDQVEAFCDTWELDETRERAIKTMPVLMREQGIDDTTVEFWRLWMNALRNTQPRLLAYLSYMVERLLQMKLILKPTGSIYLHCDPTASHYLKAMMDAIFGHQNFRNEIVWRRTSAHSGARRWGPIHDTLLFYSKSGRYTWNRTVQQYDEEYLENFYRHSDDRGRHRLSDLTGSGTRQGASGRPWRGIDPTEKGRHWAVPPVRTLHRDFEQPAGYSDMSLQERLDVLDAAGFIHWPKKGTMPSYRRYLSASLGAPIQDIIWDIPPIGSSATERLGYVTQKPLPLLERIIEASSNEGDMVLDPFCGCATTIEAAHKLGRRWIGIDIAIHAIKRVAQVRLSERLHLMPGQDYEIEGIPRNPEGAQDLWERDKYHFQKWAVEQVDGFVTSRQTGDGGIDGRLYFDMPDERDLQSMVLEVKGGQSVNIQALRALRGVLDNDDAKLAGLIIMHPLGAVKERNFRRFMADAGDLEIRGMPYPRMQILTVEEILDGKRFYTPTVAGRQGLQPSLLGG